MMSLYGADDHLLAITDSIDADSHTHAFIQVCISLRSPFDIELEGRVFPSKGIVVDSNITHSFNGHHNPLLFLLIDCTSALAAAFRAFMGDQPFCEISPERIDKITAFLESRDGRLVSKEEYPQFLTQIFRLLAIDSVEPKCTDPRIHKVMELLRNCDEPEHSVEMLAKKLSLSASRLSHLFKESTGMSLSGYLVLHKLQKAIYLIFMGTSVTDASLMAGFDSPSHFAATSKRLLGMSATDIRKDSVFLKVSRYQ
jgi:AraC-like DNA-binding protein